MAVQEQSNKKVPRHSGIVQPNQAEELDRLDSDPAFGHIMNKRGPQDDEAGSTTRCYLISRSTKLAWVHADAGDRPQALDAAIAAAKALPANKRPVTSAQGVLDENERLKGENEKMAAELEALRKKNSTSGGAAQRGKNVGEGESPEKPDAAKPK